MRLPGTLKYTLNMTFSYLENCSVWQTVGPGGAG